MTTRVLVTPTGPKATPEAIEDWKQKAQRVADEYDAGLTLNTFAEDGVTIIASIEAVPGDEEFDWEPGETVADVGVVAYSEEVGG